ncbi:MAG TPA: UPF0175 family protein [Thermoanaerobaculia bacterium]|nr:UPF0175 family protein [Thermoanaerobaculia bacterium]
MATISYEVPPSAFAALHMSPRELAREMRIAACVQWYVQGLVSQERQPRFSSGRTRSRLTMMVLFRPQESSKAESRRGSGASLMAIRSVSRDRSAWLGDSRLR